MAVSCRPGDGYGPFVVSVFSEITSLRLS